MVLSLSRPTGRPQPLRITGLGVAITINLALFLLLSLPQDYIAPPRVIAPDVVSIRFIDPPRPVEVLPVPELPVPPVRQTPTRITQEVAPAPVDVPTSSYVVPWEPVALPAPPTDFVAPVSGSLPSQVSLLIAPHPPYPTIAMRQRAEGTVVLLVLVSIDGRPLRVEIEEESGHRVLDRSARDHVLQRWRFEPARREGRAVQAWARIPIDFVIPR
jgi:periplasmic protein TonB